MLLNPKTFQSACPDAGSRDVMRKTIEFFENKGLARIKHDDHERVWYADFLDFVKREKVFATLLTPSAYGGGETRWDTFRNCEMNEILGFYGLAYWYTWQVSILGLGPIWMSGNEAVKRQTAEHLRQGGIFAFGLSEKDHGADIYSSGMTLESKGQGAHVLRTARSTTSATPTRRPWSRSSARWPAAAPRTTSSLPSARSTRTSSACRTSATRRTTSPSFA